MDWTIWPATAIHISKIQCQKFPNTKVANVKSMPVMVKLYILEVQ